MKQTSLYIVLVTFLAAISPYALSQFDETLIQPPSKDSNEQALRPLICRSGSNSLWDLCSILLPNNDEMAKSFYIMNSGENKIVPHSGFGIGRSFEFKFEDFARSDLSLLVWDTPDSNDSHGHLKLMTFFPREILPAIRFESRAENDVVIVTLPTREEVSFNAKTMEVVGGVFNETPMEQDQNGDAINPGVTYTGKGVVVEADRINDYPVGVAAQGNKNIATISKQGYKTCKIPVKDLWYTDNKKGGKVFFNKKYVTDQAFDKLLKKKCNFSMY
jgi:hypothetical protein